MKELQASEQSITFELPVSRNAIMSGLFLPIAGAVLFLTAPEHLHVSGYLLYWLMPAFFFLLGLDSLARLKTTVLTIDKQTGLISKVSKSVYGMQKVNSMPLNSVLTVEVTYEQGLWLSNTVIAWKFKGSDNNLALQTDSIKYYDIKKFIPNTNPRKSVEADSILKMANFIGVPLVEVKSNAESFSFRRVASQISLYFFIGLVIAIVLFS
jgi:hypothetical protein